MKDVPKVTEAVGRVGSSWKEVRSIRLQYKVAEGNELDQLILVSVSNGSGQA